MRLSHMMNLKKDQLDKSWIDIAGGDHVYKNLLWGYSKNVTRIPSPEVTETLAKFLEVQPIEVILAAAEEVGHYAPERDGALAGESGPALKSTAEIDYALAKLREAISEAL